MNREEAQEEIRKAHWNLDDPHRELWQTVDKIYDDFESRCSRCKYCARGTYCEVLGVDNIGGCADYFEEKKNDN